MNTLYIPPLADDAEGQPCRTDEGTAEYWGLYIRDEHGYSEHLADFSTLSEIGEYHE